jgi:hypothetical protein
VGIRDIPVAQKGNSSFEKEKNCGMFVTTSRLCPPNLKMEPRRAQRITELPQEIIINIFSRLGMFEVLALEQVS